MKYNCNSDETLNEDFTWKEIAISLFNLLDEIDTADDIAKGNDDLYRHIVREHHKSRFKYATTDGYDLHFKVAKQAGESC